MANPGSDSVQVIDTATNAQQANIEVGRNPTGVAISPDGAAAYVTDSRKDGRVTVIDTATNTVTANVSVGRNPTGVAITPDGGFAYVAHRRSNFVSAIDTSTNAVVSNIGICCSPTGVAITPDGAHAYAVTPGGGTGDPVIDVATNSVIAALKPNVRGFTIALTPDGTRAYVTGRFGSVFVADTATNTVFDSVRTGLSYDLAISADSARVYVPDTSTGEVNVIDTATNAITARIGVGRGNDSGPNSGPAGVALTPDGMSAYVTNPANAGVNNLVEIDTTTNTATAAVGLGGRPAGIAISP